MGDTRIDGSTWHVPEQKPADLAQIAKNMSAPKPPTDAELRGTYEKMSDGDLEKETRTLSNRLSSGGQYSGSDVDGRRFRAVEAVAQTRADKAQTPTAAPEEEGFRHLFPYFDEAAHRGKIFTVGHVAMEFTPEHIGIQATAVHAQHKKDFGTFDVAASGDAASAFLDEGIHNSDGTTGFHSTGGVTAVGGEVTIHRKGLGSVTLGASGGATVEVSAGLKQDGDMIGDKK